MGYGATYYSYLFAQCLSARIWQARGQGRRGCGQGGQAGLLVSGVGGGRRPARQALPASQPRQAPPCVQPCSAAWSCSGSPAPSRQAPPTAPPAAPPPQDHLAGNPTSRQAGELLRHRLLEPGGAKEPHSMVQDLLSGSAASSGGSGGSGTSRAGSGSGGLGAAAAAGLHASGGGFFPDLGAMLEQQGLLAA